MADLICRWRNGTAKTVVELANTLPHEKMPVDQFREKMKLCYGGDFFRTPYQLACQLALYCEAEDGFYYPRFDHDINEAEAEEYLKFWIARYFVPNPYVRKDGFQNIECPTYFLKSLCDYVKKHPSCEYKDAYYESFGETAKNNDDIIRNYINNYSKVLNFSKDGILSLTGQSLEERFAFMDRTDKKAFFDSFDTTRTKSTSSPIKSFTPAQIIYYGVPGCGKSKKIMDLLDIAKQKGEITDEEKQVVRVVFHPEYTNADFVGQVMPVVKPAGGVDYDFAAGPFTRILARAYANPTKPYFLVIEEINRGNAAAIFGEIFQLLDRHKKGESDSVGGNLYTAGWSKYFVDHVDVNGKISAEIAGTEYGSDDEKPAVTFTANTAIRLPPNLSIYATMNTSDQNVFTLDNAFKRRFDSELVKNTLDGELHKAQRETKIENTDITWGVFWEKVNELILEKNTSMISSEDKRLGAYFIIGEEKTDDAGNKYREISRKLFGEKVLEYLWDDAFKYKRSTVFKNECKSVESLIENFEEGGFAAIFKDGILGL
ncbi:AAA domain (dynein-related subfamily) [Fibrobacter sp. UWH5]|uniref:AAA family ATPase n=1 Tax=Fibrobacter sp. UWH5 TaxID=1896211 RepID=UPI00091FF2BB|nr:AAA family ATPase [Fibrobacter sp. UWH5]SHL29074.1 AAA domain (dynein-related subfamily) [Fibrobacter sp. UWH5]